MKIRLVIAALMFVSVFLPAAERRILHGHVPPAVSHLQPLAPVPGSQPMELALTLPLRNTEALDTLLQQLYDPANPTYRRFLTPEQFTQRFGPTEQDYQKVIGFARSHGLIINGIHPNRAVLDIRGPVANIEQAFRLKMRVYRHPAENRTFFSPDTEPSVDPDLPIQAISGLNDFVLPRPMNLKRAPLAQPDGPAPDLSAPTVHTDSTGPQEVRAYATGSGPGGNFIGHDFRAAYAPGVTNDGAGQSVALFEFGPFSPNSIYVYQTNANLSTNIVITTIPVNGFNTNWTGQDDGEECLDIEMAMSMAPGATLLVYEGNNGTDIFNRIATDNLARQISCSFGWSPFDASLANTFKQFAAQGQSCYIASGDGGAEVGSIFPPGDDPYVTIVGGTSLTTSGGGGPWQSETTWIGSSGGVSTKFGIPAWQEGINMQLNQGSTTMRNVPDVSIIADTVLFFAYRNGLTGTIGGTSAAAPLWAGFTALVNQQAASQGRSPAGFINPAVYALGKGLYSTYSSCFHDITTGNNFNSSSPTKYAATSGYDLCTGWGTPRGLATINFLAGTGTNDFTLYASATGLTITPGGNAATLLSVFPLAGFSGSVSLSCTGLPRGVTATLSPTATASTSFLTFTSATNAATGMFSVPVSATAGALSHSLTVFLTVALPIPGAATANLASAYNRAGIYTDGTGFSGGLDNDGYAYSANLLGTAPSLNGVQFHLGPANALDAIRATGQTLALPSGQFTTLQMLATAVNGNQVNQTFIVTYTDNSTATFTQSLSDWAAPQNYAGELSAVRMPYRNSGSGAKDTGTAVSLYQYSLTLDQTKTVQSVTLPNNGNVLLLALTLVNGPASASLAAYYNRPGMYTDGTTFTNPPTGGIDGGGTAYSASVLGYAQTWSNVLFGFGPANVTNVISCANQTVTLPPGKYSALRMLATGVQGNQTSQPFTVTYADATTTTFSQSLSDWFTPQSYSGESRAVITGHRNNSNGSKDNRTFYLYGYSFKLNSSKVVQSLRLPNNGNVIVTSVSLVPNWRPAFLLNPFSEPDIVAGQPCAGTLATNATDLNGDSLSFAKVSGPPWLAVAANGALSGVPASADVGTNTFVVQATDPGGLLATATLTIAVTPAPPIIANLTVQDSNLLLSWTGGLGPYQVLMATDLVSSAWIALGSPTTATNALLSPTNASAFYRLSGQ